MPQTIHDLAGLLGVAFYLLSFALLQLGLLRGTGYVYTVMNLVAAALVLVSLSADFNLSSAIIQVCWVVISLVGLTRQFVLRHRTRFTPSEEALRAEHFAHMSKPLVRRVLDLGTWANLPDGTVLTTEGAPVEALHFIETGSAEASFDGRFLGRVSRGFVGEMNVLSGGAASATVRSAGPVRALVIPGPALRALCARDSEIRSGLEDSFARDTRGKLMAANAQLAAHGQAARAQKGTT